MIEIALISDIAPCTVTLKLVELTPIILVIVNNVKAILISFLMIVSVSFATGRITSNSNERSRKIALDFGGLSVGLAS